MDSTTPEIPSEIKPTITNEADIAVGLRFLNERLTRIIPWYRRAGIKFLSELVNNTKQDVGDAQSGFRTYSLKSLEKLVIAESGMGASVEILIYAKK